MPRRLTSEEFINRVTKIHNDIYDYSDVIYKNSYEKILIKCKIHGIFEQTPKNHLDGCGCSKCSKRKTTDEFIKDAKNIHGLKYDYAKVQYDKADSKIEILCKIHGIFFQNPSNHLRGANCPKCTGHFPLSMKEFIDKSNIKHNNLYDYSKTILHINGNKSIITGKTIIICKIHGDFKQSVKSHMQGKGCPVCKKSKGELKIRKILIDNNILFIEEHKFDNCKNKRPLPFDFFIPSLNCCIEFDGLQHSKVSKFFGGEIRFQHIKQNDFIKTEYCKYNGIKLIRISSAINNPEDYLLLELNKIKHNK